jgi:hypothetical protein
MTETIRGLSATATGDNVRVTATVSLSGTVKTLTADATRLPEESMTDAEDRAIAELRKTLYASGVPKRAIATVVNRHKERRTDTGRP